MVTRIAMSAFLDSVAAWTAWNVVHAVVSFSNKGVVCVCTRVSGVHSLRREKEGGKSEWGAPRVIALFLTAVGRLRWLCFIG